MIFKTTLKEYPVKSSLKQSDLAQMVGVRRETIGYLES